MVYNIQVLRAIAALFVIVVHCDRNCMPSFVNEKIIVGFGNGVDLFFVISGFIIARTIMKRDFSSKDFFFNRIRRIVPSYWLLTSLVYFIALAYPAFFNGTQANLPNLVGSLFFIPYTRLDNTVRPLLFVGWSLNYEMFFYLIVSICLLFSKNIYCVLVTIFVTCCSILLGSLHARPDAVIYKFWTAPILIEFVLGLILALSAPYLPRGALVGTVAAVCAAASLVALVCADLIFQNFFPSAALPAATLVLCAVITEQSGFIVNFRPIIILGNASYSMYLTHPFVAQIVNKLIISCGTSANLFKIFYLIAVYVLCIAVGLAFYRLVELNFSFFANKITSS